ncbi:efflux transporter outer membrane subunit [Cupriavidus necator]|uniref:RND efflux system, outer membrane lipoprotein, NodT n=1 Tax=Cupriavidus pinatubonensis (strain JMP 134 / LMG 1197) TaxID=264198 RepID=Q46MN6_CUPPJ|nr:efflux transporter outer membrane subunit [Cupriavidus necator]
MKLLPSLPASIWRLRPLSISLLALTLAGCSLAPHLAKPDAPIPAAWSGPAVGEGTSFGLDELVVDPVLCQLIQSAVQNNRDLRQAMLNVDAARLRYRVQGAERLPTIEGRTSLLRSKSSIDDPSGNGRQVSEVYRSEAAVPSFEVDLWGRLRNLSDAAFAEYLAEEQNAQSARLTLISEVMSVYVRRIGALARFEAVSGTLAARQRTLDLLTLRRDAGATSALELEDARGLTESAAADLEAVRRDVEHANNALLLLTGLIALPDMPQHASDSPTSVVTRLAAGAPSELLYNRPDVRAAEHALHARNADIGAARAAFFPRISLTGEAGSLSGDLSGLFAGGRSFWNFLPSIQIPIFSGGRNRSNLELATVRKEIAIAKYEGTVQVAFREVADALSTYQTLGRELSHRKALMESSKVSLALSEQRQKSGLDSNLRYLDAQRVALTNEVAFIDASTAMQVSIVQTFKALGGRWYQPATMPRS